MKTPLIPPKLAANRAAAVGVSQRWAALAAQQANMAQQAEGSGWPATVEPDYNARALDMFVRRMGGVRNEFRLHPKDFLHCHVFDDKVFVFFLLNGKEGVVAEGADIFPSDQLIAQFKMIVAS